jgi:hypothetical protein
MDKTSESNTQSPPKAELIRGSAITALIRYKVFVALFLFLFSFIAFAPSLKGDFVWDDVEYIQKTPFALDVSQIPYKAFPRFLNARGVSHIRPLLFTSFVIDRKIWGVSPFGFHLSSIILYSVSTVLFYFFAIFILGEFNVKRKESSALLCSLFFALYPTHVESVSFIGARGDLICSIFFFLAFIFHILSYRKLRLFPLAAFCFLLSLFSKEVGVVFPLAALGFDILRRRYRNGGNVLRYTVYAGLILAYFYLRGKSGPIIPGAFSANVDEAAGNQINHIWAVLVVLLNTCLFYVKKLVFPFHTNPFIPTVPSGSYHLFISILVMSLLCVFSLVSIIKKENITAFSIFWVFITLAPSCYAAIFPIAVIPIAERFLYIPSAGYCMVIGYLIVRASEEINIRGIDWTCGLLLCMSYLLITTNGQSIWKNNLSLWKEASKEAPDYASPHGNYGAALLIAGETDKAMHELSVTFDPKIKGSRQIRAYAANNLGILYMNEKRDLENAERWFQKAVFYDPRFYRAYYHLGILYFIKGKSTNSVSYYRKAEWYLNKTLEIYPPYGRASLFLAKIYIELGEREKAKEYAKEALQKGLIPPLDKEAEDIVNMGN